MVAVRRRRRLQFDVLIQGPGQQGLSQTVICKQAGAALIIVTGTSKDGARLRSPRRSAPIM